ncbi:MAG: peptide chain release factor N(5)-glutamine methyltransferase [Pirellulaceae bacterium]
MRRLLDWTSEYFQQQGAGQPRLDAEILLAEALQCARIDLYTRFDEEPDAPARDKFRDWVARHAEGEPVAYLVGHREFFSLKFEVNSSVLIPRPETEHLVSEALDAIPGFSHQPPRVVDVGTGSGNVAISIAKHAQEAQVVAADICDEALAVARRNAETHDLSGRISFVKSDLLDDVKQFDEVDLIVSNPPYVGQNETDQLDKSVLEFEPHQALFAGPQGTDIISRLIRQAAERLTSDGLLMFEISPMIADTSREMVAGTQGLEFVRIVNDLAGLQRIVVARKTAGG